jgi:hypothetical protein
MNQGVTVNLPLASANGSSADVDAPHILQRPSYSSTLRTGFETENLRTLRDIRLGQLHRRWNADSSFIPQAMQIGSSIRPMLCRCLFNGQCSVTSPTKVLNLDLSSLSKYLIKPTQIVQWLWRPTANPEVPGSNPGYGFSVEVWIFLTFFWFRRTIKFDTYKPEGMTDSNYVWSYCYSWGYWGRLSVDT